MIIFIFGGERRTYTVLSGINKGFKIFASAKAELSLIFGSFEPQTQIIIKHFVSPGDVVFDIGANVGYFTLSCSKLVGEKGKIYSFEAIPKTAEILEKNCLLNSLKNITLYKKAVSDKKEKLTFLIPDHGKNHTMASMVWHKEDCSVKKVSVDSIVIDYNSDLSKLSPSFIKIDVEGAEAFVLKGMKSMLQNNSPIIFIECSEAGRKESWSLLKSFGYTCYKGSIPLQKVNDFNLYKHNDFLWMK